MEVANTQAYYDTATITAIKIFIGQVPCLVTIIVIRAFIAKGGGAG